MKIRKLAGTQTVKYTEKTGVYLAKKNKEYAKDIKRRTHISLSELTNRFLQACQEGKIKGEEI